MDFNTLTEKKLQNPINYHENHYKSLMTGKVKQEYTSCPSSTSTDFELPDDKELPF